MIIPMVCFSCGKPIAHMWDDYVNLVKQFETESVESKEEKVASASAGTSAVGSLHRTQTPEFRALARLSIGRECCRRMFLCQHDMYDKVK